MQRPPMHASLNDETDVRTSGISRGVSLYMQDGFYDDPDGIRERAIAAEYSAKEHGTYAGRNAKTCIVEPDTVDALTRLVGAPLVRKDGEAFGVFRFSFLNDPYGNFIHSDPVQWGGVLFLNPPDASRGGTAFWRHRETGLEQFPWDNFAEYGFSSAIDAWNKLVKDDGLVPSRWEMTQMIPARYNRLIVFNSRLFHSQMPYESFGMTKETARLVQIFFFST